MPLQMGIDDTVDEMKLAPHLRKLAPSKMEHKFQVDKSKLTPHPGGALPAQKANLGLRVNGAPLPPQIRNMPILDDGPDSQPARCDYCKLVLANDTALAKHKMERMLANDGHTHCHICYMDYKAKGTLIDHMRTIHPARQDLNCPGCDAHFERLSTLIGHLECDECPDIRASQVAEAREANLEFASALNALSKAPIVRFDDGDDEAVKSRCLMETCNANPVFFEKDDFKRKKNPTYEVEVLISSDGNASQGSGSGDDKAKNATAGDNSSSEGSGWGEANDKNDTSSGGNSALGSGWGVANDKNDTALGGNSAKSSGEDKNGTAPAGTVVTFMMAPDLLDPAHPSFRIQHHWDKWLKKYVCPEPYCGKSFHRANQLISHLYSAAHGRGVKLTCPQCNKHFSSVLAIVQHSESQSTRCRIRDSIHSGIFFSQVTGGVADKAGYHGDGTVKYRVHPEAALRFRGNQMAAAMKGEEEKQEQEEKQENEKEGFDMRYDSLMQQLA